jgi:hypothetical protein
MGPFFLLFKLYLAFVLYRIVFLYFFFEIKNTDMFV